MNQTACWSFQGMNCKDFYNVNTDFFEARIILVRIVRCAFLYFLLVQVTYSALLMHRYLNNKLTIWLCKPEMHITPTTFLTSNRDLQRLQNLLYVNAAFHVYAGIINKDYKQFTHGNGLFLAKYYSMQKQFCNEKQMYKTTSVANESNFTIIFTHNHFPPLSWHHWKAFFSQNPVSGKGPVHKHEIKMDTNMRLLLFLASLKRAVLSKWSSLTFRANDLWR